jgi:hypothetical protein
MNRLSCRHWSHRRRPCFGRAGAGWLVWPSLSISDISQAVARDTGRTLTFAGRARMSLWPELAIELRDVELSNPAGVFGWSVRGR